MTSEGHDLMDTYTYAIGGCWAALGRSLRGVVAGGGGRVAYVLPACLPRGGRRVPAPRALTKAYSLDGDDTNTQSDGQWTVDTRPTLE
eukprot:COSAG03_NODE_2203_length_3014_cov_19.724382_3_plen_88_part_00